MRIKFDGHQEYQLDAINAVVDLFDGQPLAGGQFSIQLDPNRLELFTELGMGNALTLDDAELLSNARAIQRRNELPEAAALASHDFTVEMETGTGKTYVYLRTIHELRARYGFTKFIIVVPTVAIREGVLKNIELTRAHFADLYGNPPVDAWVYDSKQVSRLRQFAASNQLQILIINIDAFNKKANNVIHKENDRLSGRRPIEFIESARPIVILDEPQNMESEQARTAITGLNPLCTLRYSATHRNLYTLLYRLDPVRAYDLRLVKRIEVDSVLDDPDFNQPYINVLDIQTSASGPWARLELDTQGASGPVRRQVTIRRSGVDLFDITGGRAAYTGYIVDEIDAGAGYIAFANGMTLDIGQSQGSQAEQIMQVQIEETVKAHLAKELEIRRRLPEGERLKVLSLFFIDRVANYAAAEGKLRRWFVDAYSKHAALARYAALELPAVEVVHDGYFAKTKNGQVKDTTGLTVDDNAAYQLIMRDKERLLALDEPLRFIFSHSALREGWDNPNVFQICTLHESRSEIRKRQEIGRGMRLPVLETGERCHDPNVNILTVIANESYQAFASKLQTEIEEECGVAFEGRIRNRRDRRVLALKKEWRLNPDFLTLWERIKHCTRYRVEFSTAELVQSAAREVSRMAVVESPRVRAERARLELSTAGVDTIVQAVREVQAHYDAGIVPDLLGYLQERTELTRGTLTDILIGSGRLGDVPANPQQFLDGATRAIQHALHRLMVAGIKYERIGDAEYEMLRFEEHEIVAYADRLLDVHHSIYDAIEYDSENERRFATELDARDDIKLFIKLPAWFTVETPLGTYNPDWAIVKQERGAEERLYLVAETKSTQQRLDLRNDESDKIACGEAHFAVLSVDYTTATSAADI